MNLDGAIVTYQEKDFVRHTRIDGTHKNFQYKEGLNEGGLYFCRFKDFGKWVCLFNDALLWKVEIPEGEPVIEFKENLKAKRIILSQPVKLYEHYNLAKIAVENYGYAVEHIREQTEELCLAAVKQYGLSLQCVNEQTEEICMTAVQQDGLALVYVKQQTPEICKLAVQNNSLLLNS